MHATGGDRGWGDRSRKTTQLPKICMELGSRGEEKEPDWSYPAASSGGAYRGEPYLPRELQTEPRRLHRL